MNEAKKKTTLLGEAFDDLARSNGQWPDEAICYALEVINDNQIMMTGEIPIGTKRNGDPKFARAKGVVFRAVVGKDAYRAVADEMRAKRSCAREELKGDANGE